MQKVKDWLAARGLKLRHVVPAAVIVLITLYAFACAGAARASDVDGAVIRIACKDRATVEKHADMIVADRAYQRAGATLEADVQNGDCAISPVPIPVRVVTRGQERVFVDSDGDTMSLVVVQVEDRDVPRVRAWTIILTKVRGV